MHLYKCMYQKKVNCVEGLEQSSADEQIFELRSLLKQLALLINNVTKRANCTVSLVKYFRVVSHASFFFRLPQSSCSCFCGDDQTVESQYIK